jgi:hypothetical protein
MTGDAIPTAGCDVVCKRGGALRSFGAFARVGTVVAGVAAGRTHRRMVHCVGHKTCRGIGVAIAALDAGHRNMRRRGHPGRCCPVVTTRAIGIACLMDISAACPACISRGRTGMAGDAVAATSRHVAGI